MLSVENMRTTLNTFESDQKYRLLLEITNAIVSNLDRDDLFHAIAKEIQKARPLIEPALHCLTPRQIIFRSMR